MGFNTLIDDIHTNSCFELAIVRETGLADRRELYHLRDDGAHLAETTNQRANYRMANRG
jgi:hypothetical protein